MKCYAMLLLIVVLGLYAQSAQDIRLLDRTELLIRQSVPNNPYGFPVEVRANPEIKLQHGTPPFLPVFDKDKLKENLKPQTARKVENIQYKRMSNPKTVSFSRAEAIASYKAMIQKQIALEELKQMVKSGATDEEIESFKMATDEKILQTRLTIMKAFGSQDEIKATEEAIIKFNYYKSMKAKEEK